MLSEALPLTSVTVPSVVAPSLNVTVPVGTAAPEVTVELSVTACPTVEGFGVDVRLVDVAAAAGALTTGVTVGEVLAANVALPLYVAVSGWVPTVSVDVTSEALPLTSVTVPSTVAPSLNVTVPVGTPAADVTVELSVTAWPLVEGLGLEVRLVEVAAGFTIWVTVGDVLAANVALPLYVAESGWLPTVRVDVTSEALPFTSVTVPSTVAPSRNVTVPVGRPTAGAKAVTVVLSVTACPTTDGFGVVVRVVAVGPGFTVWVRTAEVLAANSRSPL